MSRSEDSASGARHRGREVALQVLYALDLGETGPRDAALVRAEKARFEAEIGPGRPPRPEPPPSQEPELSPATVDPAQASVAAFERVEEHFVVPSAAAGFARELVEGVSGCVDQIDELVGQHARNWRVSRMAAVDRNVLRLAVYELRDTDTPVAIVIDQAVDLARRFGSDRSPSFVNGVLDAVAREVRAA